MKNKLWITLLVLLLAINDIAHAEGLYDLGLSDEDYTATDTLTTSSGRKLTEANPKLALLLAKLSDIAYETSLSDIDKLLLDSNGFINPTFFEYQESLVTKTSGLVVKKRVEHKGQIKNLNIVAFRGTASKLDALGDLAAFPARFLDLDGVRVHSGFNALRKQFTNNEGNHLNITEGESGELYIITGHSLGGAIAKLYAATLIEGGVDRSRVLVYTFGAPPVSYNDGGFKARYDILRGEKPFNIIEVSNELDPVYNLESKYIASNVGYLNRTGLNPIAFEASGNIKSTSTRGCNIGGTVALDSTDLLGRLGELEAIQALGIRNVLNFSFLAEITFQAYERDLPDCRASDHSINLYIYNLFQSVDVVSIIESNVLDASGDSGFDYVFSDYQLNAIENILKREQFQNGVFGQRFDSTSLSSINRKILLSELRKLGIFSNPSLFGSLGAEFQTINRQIVSSKEGVLNAARDEIDSQQLLELGDLAELGLGVALNAAAVSADIFSAGSAAAARFSVAAAKMGKFSGKVNDLTKAGKLTAKAMPSIRKAIAISETPAFKIAVALAQYNFTVTDEVKEIISENDAGVDQIKIAMGLSGDLLNAQLTDSNKVKLVGFLISKLVDIGVKVTQGTTEVLYEDEQLRMDFYALLDDLSELIPFYGPFRSTYKLSKKVSDDIDKKEGVIDAWTRFDNINKNMLEEIRVIGGAFFSKRLDITLSKALEEINSNYIRLEEEAIVREENRSRLLFTLPAGAELDGYTVQAEPNSTIQFAPHATAKSLRSCIVDASTNQVEWKLWFIDLNKGAQATRESLILDFDEQGQSYSFSTPSSRIRIIDLTYEILDDPTSNFRFFSCGLPDLTNEANNTDGTTLNMGLVAHYKFEGNADDSSGNGNHGTDFGGLAFESGVDGQGASFDGIDDHILVLDSTSFPSESISLSLWVKRATPSNFVEIFVSKNLSFQSYQVGGGGGGQLQSDLWKGSFGNWGTYSSVNYVNSMNQWDLYTFTFSNAEKIARTYINGELNNEEIETDINAMLRLSSDPLYIGRNGAESVQFLKAVMDELRIYNRVLTGEEIRSLYAAKTSLSDGLVAHYEFEDNANDSSGNNNDGTENGGVSYTDGVIGKAASFDGVDDYFLVNDSSLFPENAITMSYWAKRGTASTGLQNYISKELSFQSYLLSDGAFQSGFWKGQPGQWSGYVTDSNIYNELDKWLHYTITFDNNSKKAKGYINGVLVHTEIETDMNSFIRRSSEPMYIGRNGSQNVYHIKGLLDDLRIYDRELSESEIQNLYKLGESMNLNPDGSSVIFLDNFDDGSPVSDKWSVKASQGCCGPGVLSNITKQDDVLNLNLTGQSSGFSGVSDGSVLSPKDIALDGDFYLETLVKEIGRERNSGYKDNSGIGISLVKADNQSYLHGVSIRGNFSGYADGYNYNEYEAHRVAGANILHELELDELYSLAMRMIRVGDSLIIGYKINNVGEWIDTQVELEVGIRVVPQLVISSGDGGRTIINGNFEAEVEYFRIFSEAPISNPRPSISLVRETILDGSIVKNSFTKEWVFNADIDEFNVNVLSNNYSGVVSDSDFIKNGNKLSIDLVPNISEPINELILELKDSSNQTVRVSGSETIWSITKTNNAPRLADGQVDQLTSLTSEPAFLNLDVFDADGDNIAITIEDDSGGFVGFDPDNPSRIFASFNDGVAEHIIQIGLDDGKEKTIQSLRVLQFDQTSISDFYSDVDPSSTDYRFGAIAFATIEGVVSGQPNPDNLSQRIFRPNDSASLAETLKIVVNAQVKAGLINLPNTDLYSAVFPRWAMPYYTFAREREAIDAQVFNLADTYPTREQVAKLIVKTLYLDNKSSKIPTESVSFTDEELFSGLDFLYYSRIAKQFGLFMLSEAASPQDFISRAELVEVVEKVFRLPQARVELASDLYRVGDIVAIDLLDVKASKINDANEVVSAVSELSFNYFLKQELVENPLDTHELTDRENDVCVELISGGVKNVVCETFDLQYVDGDGDGAQDRNDLWPADNRYVFDLNNNSIPDILDFRYGLSALTDVDSFEVGGRTIAVSQIIEEGVFDFNISADTDGDTVLDFEDNCTDVANPEQENLDKDLLGDLCDSDADGDGVLSGADSDDLNGQLCGIDQDLDLCDDCSSGSLDILSDGLDTDADGACNVGDLDDDGDGVDDQLDNCPLIANPNQADVCSELLEESLCFPVPAKNGAVSIICL